MPIYTVTYTETIEGTVEFEAKSIEQARALVKGRNIPANADWESQTTETEFDYDISRVDD